MSNQFQLGSFKINGSTGNQMIGLVCSIPIRLVGLASAFDGHSSIKILANNLPSFLEDRTLKFLLVDLSFDQDWMGTLLRIRRVRPDLRLIVVGPGNDIDLMLHGITAGARAYLNPECDPDDVRNAVEYVIEGYIWAPHRVLSIIIDRISSQSFPLRARSAAALSPRERQVLDRITSGNSNRQIGVDLGIEERTVKAYVASLFRKVGVENRLSLSVETLRDSNLERRRIRDSSEA